MFLPPESAAGIEESWWLSSFSPRSLLTGEKVSPAPSSASLCLGCRAEWWVCSWKCCLIVLGGFAIREVLLGFIRSRLAMCSLLLLLLLGENTPSWKPLGVLLWDLPQCSVPDFDPRVQDHCWKPCGLVPDRSPLSPTPGPTACLKIHRKGWDKWEGVNDAKRCPCLTL